MSKTYKCNLCKRELATRLGDVCETCRPHYDAWYATLAVACKRAARREAYDDRVEADIREARAARSMCDEDPAAKYRRELATCAGEVRIF